MKIIILIISLLFLVGCVQDRTSELCGILVESLPENSTNMITYRNQNCIIEEEGYDTVYALRCSSLTQKVNMMFKIKLNETKVEDLEAMKSKFSGFTTKCDLLKMSGGS